MATRHSPGRPQQERAQRVIDEIYPGGVPSQADLPNKKLFGKVDERLKHLGLDGVSDDTILRAAGRRPDRNKRKWRIVQLRNAKTPYLRIPTIHIAVMETSTSSGAGRCIN
jgi:hypothetical protein